MEHAAAEPHWITTPMALEIHRRQIARYGGSDGVRDLGLLDSALNRPRNVFHYEGPVPLARLAASYCFGISRNHPFIDGNKRVSFVVASVFMLLNGFNVEASEDDVVETMLAVASGEMSEEALTDWFAHHVAPR
ncbi:MAG: type II toxin-antitoxin system death-on-curing family toxin [Candidatus Hydrogenedentes bacterium]|nr:type II toxin-antitoxin system death-on-curing family toxin [Candidatus Hydrogenedentota bacterium]